ncbi:MAG: CTP synthase [Dehalococcoidia bacterium]|nr:CTP synthase [Dehalococcoidia bacterium]
MAKYIFVTGGVVSSVGKGIVVASTGRILKSRGISVSLQKLDPYLNVDPGTMSPYQHGEVFVTEDGAETDLDLGHYERFIDINLTRASSITTGQIYRSVLNKERRGDFLGGTIQVVPHVTNEIKGRIMALAREGDPEVIIVEVGGTVGDIEGQPFLEAARQIRNDVGRDNVVYIHVTYLPYIQATGELKTKPTQHSVQELRRIGIQPDIILCRTEHEMAEDIKDKIALHCDVEKRAVIPLPTVPTVYQVPLILEEAGMGDLLVDRLGLARRRPDLTEWQDMVTRIYQTDQTIPIAIVGKYVQLKDAYLSVVESLRHAALHYGQVPDIQWIAAEDLEQPGAAEARLRNVKGIVVPGGFGYRGLEGMVAAANYARVNEVPYLGLCLGFQVMVIELARHVLGTQDANSTEFDENTSNPVIDLMPDQRGVQERGGTMRLGSYPCHLVPGTKVADAYGCASITERHRHRFEVNNDYRDILASGGLVWSGLSPDGSLVEVAELAQHPWMVGSQFHPEFTTRPTRPHPLFRAFIAAAERSAREGDQFALSELSSGR